MKDLSEIRVEIDKIDREMIDLFRRRMDCAKDVAAYKQANHIPVLNAAREREILDRIEDEGGEYGAYARLLYTNIMELSRSLQHKLLGSGKEMREMIRNASSALERENVRVAYQGIDGANSHEAALRLFPKATLSHYPTFSDVFDAVSSRSFRISRSSGRILRRSVNVLTSLTRTATNSAPAPIPPLPRAMWRVKSA